MSRSVGQPTAPGPRSYRRAALALVAVVVAGDAALYVIRMMLAPPSTAFPAPVTIQVEKGESAADIAKKLEQAGVIRSAKMLLWYLRQRGLDRSIAYGEYCFRRPLSTLAAADKFRRRDLLLRKFTVPEGATMVDVAALASRAGLGDKNALLSAMRSPQWQRKLGLQVDSLEGYLFPDTYSFMPGEKPECVISAMLDRFLEVWSDLAAEPSPVFDGTPSGRHRVVTVASMVQKETRVEDEMDLIAGIIYERLRRGMLLQIEPTVRYALGKPTGRLKRSELQVDSPYNTYRYKGLPPGPICNPGRRALRAALQPRESPYLYFVSRNDGTHQFSRTLREHNRAVARYQRGGH